ncbi:MAG: 4Fe-4S ferredoxin [Deltaproteobacteria bacterium]|nr:4Fe-4S ferredoxin [Deltaproteobacteria bacterium]
MGRPAWQIKIITAFWPIRNILARMVGWPVIGRWMRLTFRGDRASFIPVKVDVERPDSVVLPGAVVEQFIKEASFRFILHQCLCRSLEPCANYPREIGCLFLGEGAREIAFELGREATVEEALAHHRQALTLGLIPMMGKLRWDSLWLGVKKADQLLTICHCCDCCCYFKLYRFFPQEAAKGLQKIEGLNVLIEKSCDGCGVCVERCFIKAMTVEGGKAVVGQDCRGCGRCAMVCPRQAVKILLFNPPHLQPVE